MPEALSSFRICDFTGQLAGAGAPYRFTANPWRISRRAPRLGEHNDEVLGELEKQV